MDQTTVTRHDDRGRFELDVDGTTVAFAEFSGRGDTIVIPYIETDPAQRGRGWSSVLMSAVADDVRARGVTIRATCPVARAHLAEHAPDVLAD